MTIERTNSDPSFERRLLTLYAAPIPPGVAAEVNRRVDEALNARPRHVAASAGPFHRRAIAGLVLAVLLVALGAMPVLRLFEDWGRPFDRVFALSTPIEQTVVYDDYRVTVVRAYADAVSVQLAMTVEDLAGRGWAEVHVGRVSVTDGDGLAYPQQAMFAEQPQSQAGENWLQFRTPASAAAVPHHRLRVEVTAIAARGEVAPTLDNGEVDLEHVWDRITGTWVFEFDLAFHAPRTVQPQTRHVVNGIAVVLEELTVTPAATIGRLSFTGLPPVDDPAWGWDPYLRVVHDGQELTLMSLAPGSVSDRLEFTADPGFDDLSGTWVVTIDQFHRDIPDPNSDVTTEEESLHGPWVLEYTR